MRYAVVAVVFAAGAIAVPFQKRDLVFDYDVVTITDVVTVTASASTSSVKSSATSPVAHYGHHSHWYSSQSTSSTEAPSSAAPASSSSSTSVAPPPSSTTPVSSAAPTTSSTPAPAPSSYSAPPPSSSAQPTSAAATSTSAAAASPASYQEISVYHHNLHRTNHSAPDIEWDSGLASTAATIAASCIYAHNTDQNGGGYGQNIAAGVEANNVSAIITDLFYNGEVGWYDGLYGQAQPSMVNFEHFGHFTQIVWKDTTKVGCATQYCPGGLQNTGSDVAPYFTVCNYSPPGNYANEYGSNVGASLNQPTADWNAGL